MVAQITWTPKHGRPVEDSLSAPHYGFPVSRPSSLAQYVTESARRDEHVGPRLWQIWLWSVSKLEFSGSSGDDLVVAIMDLSLHEKIVMDTIVATTGTTSAVIVQFRGLGPKTVGNLTHVSTLYE